MSRLDSMVSLRLRACRESCQPSVLKVSEEVIMQFFVTGTASSFSLAQLRHVRCCLRISCHLAWQGALLGDVTSTVHTFHYYIEHVTFDPTFYKPSSALHTLHFTLCTLHFCTLHSALYTLHSALALYAPHSTIPTSLSTHYIPPLLPPQHFIVSSLLFALHTLHSTPFHTSQCTLVR